MEGPKKFMFILLPAIRINPTMMMIYIVTIFFNTSVILLCILPFRGITKSHFIENCLLNPFKIEVAPKCLT